MAKARDSFTRLARYCRARQITFGTLGAELGVTGATATRYCLPREEADHRRPGQGASDKLADLTCGVIHAGNYAEEITEAEARVMMMEIGARGAAQESGL